MVRGELWWAVLPQPVGRRPVLVVQSDEFNKSRIGTILVALVTSNVGRAAAPGNVVLSRRVSGLPRPSVVNVSQLFAVPRVVLRERLRVLDAERMKEVDRGLRLVLALPS